MGPPLYPQRNTQVPNATSIVECVQLQNALPMLPCDLDEQVESAVEDIRIIASLVDSYGGMKALAGFGSPQRHSAFVKELTPLLHMGLPTAPTGPGGGRGSLKRANEQLLMEEIAFGLVKAGGNLFPGPHRTLRHPSLRLLWWQRARGKEELSWRELWRLLEGAAGWQARAAGGGGGIAARGAPATA